MRRRCHEPACGTRSSACRRASGSAGWRCAPWRRPPGGGFAVLREIRGGTRTTVPTWSAGIVRFKAVKPAREIIVRIVLVSPPVGIDYGIQKGSGSDYETLHIQRPTNPRAQIVFDVPITVTDSRPEGLPNFTGPFVQGPVKERFLYVDVGKY